MSLNGLQDFFPFFLFELVSFKTKYKPTWKICFNEKSARLKSRPSEWRSLSAQFKNEMLLKVSLNYSEIQTVYLPMMPFTLTDSCVLSTIEFFRLSKTEEKTNLVMNARWQILFLRPKPTTPNYLNNLKRIYCRSHFAALSRWCVFIGKFDTCSVWVVVATSRLINRLRQRACRDRLVSLLLPSSFGLESFVWTKRK